ncbi:MOS1T transposase, partial [Pseudoatta argentina]
MIQKQGHWVPYELKPRSTASTAEKKRFFASHRIVTGDEKWIHYDNPKRRKSWGKPGHASTSSAKPHVAKPVKTYLETLKWEVLPHPPYSPDIAPSDFHLFLLAAFKRQSQVDKEEGGQTSELPLCAQRILRRRRQDSLSLGLFPADGGVHSTFVPAE